MHVMESIWALQFKMTSARRPLLGLTVTIALLALLVSAALSVPACRISEYPCKNNRCIRLDSYCDGSDDCGDNSDEPRYCTVCNRTYYGDVGKTYSLLLGRPSRVPFLCHLTFTANGHIHGDIVQLIFDAFNVGRYAAMALDGCPDGYMQLSELGRPFTGGSWCGASSGYAVYYSETSTITVSVKLFSTRSDSAFDFKLRYKFVSQSEAVVRFGAVAAPLERGAVSPGTYCTRNYEECYRKPCRLQSPNYPGMYPRNVTCYWSLRQKTIPTCKHAMIAVRQDSVHKMQMKRSISMASMNKTARALRAWRDCTGERDQLIFYDGPSTDDAVLATYCGGDWLPRVVSRGPEMLVAFHSSPFSAPPPGAAAATSSAQPPAPLRGFELDVDIIFTDSDSLDYSRESRRCEFHVNASSQDGEYEPEPEPSTSSRPPIVDGTETSNSGTASAGGGSGGRGGRRGRLLSPRHTLAPNSTCTYTFHGRPGDRVWVYFVSYSHHSLIPTSDKDMDNNVGTMRTSPPSKQIPPPFYFNATFLKSLGREKASASSRIDYREFERERPVPPTPAPKSTCSTRLRIWDGGSDGELQSKLIGDHCDDNPPRLCDHTSLSNATRITRPCTIDESYLSTGPMMIIQHHTVEGTALHPANFRLRYEFVDTRLAGENWPEGLDLIADNELLDLGEEKHKDPTGTVCSRIFKNIIEGEFNSPRNVFLFGRGGAPRISCALRVSSRRALRLRARAAPLPGPPLNVVPEGREPNQRDVLVPPPPPPPCRTIADPHTERPRCVLFGDTTGANEEALVTVPHLALWEVPWEGIRLPLGCICDNWTNIPSLEGIGRSLEIRWSVPRLRPSDDAWRHHFKAKWMPAPGLPSTTSDCSKDRWFSGSGGEVYSDHPPSSTEDVNCAGSPWLLEARHNRSLFLLAWGTAMALGSTDEDGPHCSTKNRLLVYTGHPPRLVKVVCPGRSGSGRAAVQVFSEEWFAPAPPPPAYSTRVTRSTRTPSFLVEFYARERGSVSFTWMEITRPRSSLLRMSGADAAATAAAANDTADCPHRCPELDACIGEALWCDGRAHCPSGRDEAVACGPRLPVALPAMAAAALAVAAAACAVILAARRRSARRKQPPPPLTALLDTSSAATTLSS